MEKPLTDNFRLSEFACKCGCGALSTAFQRACKRAGKVDFHFHDLRHFCASYLINNGTPLFTVSKYLGHRSVKTTEIYAHLNDENLEGAGETFTEGTGKAVAPSLTFSNPSPNLKLINKEFFIIPHII